MQEQTENKLKRNGCLTILLVLAGLSIFGIVLASFAIKSPTNNIQPVQENVVSTQKGKIDVKRETIVNVFKNNGYIFKKDKPIDGQENFVARFGKGEIQLLGDKENLNSASFTAYMGTDANGSIGQSVEAQAELVLFASIVDKSCKDWLVKHQLEASKNVNQIYNKTEIACGRKLTLIYFPTDSMTFGVTPAN